MVQNSTTALMNAAYEGHDGCVDLLVKAANLLSLESEAQLVEEEATYMLESLKVPKLTEALETAMNSGNMDQLEIAIRSARGYPPFVASQEAMVEVATHELRDLIENGLSVAVQSENKSMLMDMLRRAKALPPMADPESQLEAQQNKAEKLLRSLMLKKQQSIYDTEGNDFVASLGFDPMVGGVVFWSVRRCFWSVGISGRLDFRTVISSTSQDTFFRPTGRG
jgi:hypothetical protein